MPSIVILRISVSTEEIDYNFHVPLERANTESLVSIPEVSNIN